MNRIDPVAVALPAPRKPETGGFGSALRAAAAGVARGLAATAEIAAPFVPGGAVLSGVLRAATRATPGAAPGQGGASDEAALLEATRSMQQEARTFNLEYLQLQEGMQRESRAFTAVSNVMKVKHDSAKSAINNIH